MTVYNVLTDESVRVEASLEELKEVHRILSTRNDDASRTSRTTDEVFVKTYAEVFNKAHRGSCGDGRDVDPIQALVHSSTPQL